MKNGLVLEGGGMRSLFSEGVFNVLLNNGIEFDSAILLIELKPDKMRHIYYLGREAGLKELS